MNRDTVENEGLHLEEELRLLRLRGLVALLLTAALRA